MSLFGESLIRGSTLLKCLLCLCFSSTVKPHPPSARLQRSWVQKISSIWTRKPWNLNRATSRGYWTPPHAPFPDTLALHQWSGTGCCWNSIFQSRWVQSSSEQSDGGGNHSLTKPRGVDYLPPPEMGSMAPMTCGFLTAKSLVYTVSPLAPIFFTVSYLERSCSNIREHINRRNSYNMMTTAV